MKIFIRRSLKYSSEKNGQIPWIIWHDKSYVAVYLGFMGLSLNGKWLKWLKEKLSVRKSVTNLLDNVFFKIKVN